MYNPGPRISLHSYFFFFDWTFTHSILTFTNHHGFPHTRGNTSALWIITSAFTNGSKSLRGQIIRHILQLRKVIVQLRQSPLWYYRRLISFLPDETTYYFH